MNLRIEGSYGRKPNYRLSSRQRSRIRSEFRASLVQPTNEPARLDIPDELPVLVSLQVPDGMQVSDKVADRRSNNGIACDTEFTSPFSSSSSYGLFSDNNYSSPSVGFSELPFNLVDPLHSTLNCVSDGETDDEAGGYDSDWYLESSDEDDEALATSVESDSNGGGTSFDKELASCFVECNISEKAGDKILAVLRRHKCFTSLPKTTKTLLGMQHRPSVLLNVNPGQYLHLGFEAAIVSLLKRTDPNEILSLLKIDFSTDGATLGKTSSYQIWPIQCRIANINHCRTEVIGVYRGRGKPVSAIDFFEPFVEEANKLIRGGGVIFTDKRIPIVLRAFIADAPARAFILNHKGHNSYNPCSKCKITGEYVENRMTFANLRNAPRNDGEYRSRFDEDHHKEGESPLSLLPIDMVSQVPFEYMHLTCLGVMRRLIMAMVDGKFSITAKLSSYQIKLISKRLTHIADYCPTEFSRRPDKIEYYNTAKATELRQILLYVGPVIFEWILDSDRQKHFLLLHAAMRILTSDIPSDDLLFCAQELLHIFVGNCANYYGAEFVTYNVHCLLHLVDDVKLLGPVDAYSAFPYENNMKIFRRYCRKPDCTLQQIANRRAERSKWIDEHAHKENFDDTPVALNRHSDGPFPADRLEITGAEIKQYRRVKSRQFVLAATKRDSCCITKDGSICIISNIIVVNNEIQLVVRKFGRVASFYEVAIPSSTVGCYKCSQLGGQLDMVKFVDIKTKGYRMPRWLSLHCEEQGPQMTANGEFVVISMSSEVYF